jgi:outer membrane immunogenic protein
VRGCASSASAARDLHGKAKGSNEMTRNLIRSGIAAAALLLAPHAHAADMSGPPPGFGAPAIANWSGFYIGINGGYGFGTSNWDFPAVSASPDGWLVGGTLGFNFQTGSIVLGLEGDYDLTSIAGSVSCPVGFTCESKNTWLATARARLGYAGFNNWLPFITGGAAFGNIKASNTAFASAQKSATGWTAGAGIEYAFLPNWSVRAEYLYVDLGSFDCGIACGAATDNVSFTANVGRIGLNYRF